MLVFRKSKVSNMVGLSKVHIMRLVKQGDFPTPIRLGANSIGWLSTDVDAWIESKVVERDTDAIDTQSGDVK
jgi:prophage regulatory protein